MKAIVDKSHEILGVYLDIIRRVVREPHYQPYFTKDIRSFYDELVNSHTEGSERFKLSIECDVTNILLYLLKTILLNSKHLVNSKDPKKFI